MRRPLFSFGWARRSCQPRTKRREGKRSTHRLTHRHTLPCLRFAWETGQIAGLFTRPVAAAARAVRQSRTGCVHALRLRNPAEEPVAGVCTESILECVLDVGRFRGPEFLEGNPVHFTLQITEQIAV